MPDDASITPNNQEDFSQSQSLAEYDAEMSDILGHIIVRQVIDSSFRGMKDLRPRVYTQEFTFMMWQQQVLSANQSCQVAVQWGNEVRAMRGW
jgi:hypothetical protein